MQPETGGDDGIVPIAIHHYALTDTDAEPLALLAQRHLPAAELETAARYRHEGRRRQFWAGRLLVRAVLSRALRCAPAQVPIALGTYGKPAVAGSAWQFNLAHTAHWLSVVSAPHGALGLDIETHDRAINVQELSDIVLHPREREMLAQLSEPARRQTFVQLWAAKEAYVKAIGRGIAYGLAKLEVDLVHKMVMGAEGHLPLLPISAPPQHAAALIFNGRGQPRTSETIVSDLAALLAP